jgi:hypothetical protein
MRFEELAEPVAKLSKAGSLDAESIVEIKTRITTCPSTALPVREIVVEMTSPVLSASPPNGGCRVRNPSPSPLLEQNKKEDRYRPPPRH